MPAPECAAPEELPFLDKDDRSTADDYQNWPVRKPFSGRRRWLAVLFSLLMPISIVFNVVLMGLLVHQLTNPHDPTLALYSPVNHLITYKKVVFTGNRDARTKYMPPESDGLPDDEVDHEWEKLYEGTIIKVPRESAAQLVNWTSPVPGDKDNYITMLDVFHQIHCLNLIRRSLYPERYNRSMWDGYEYVPIDNHHLAHCVDSLRQLVMCHSDVSTHFWRWEPWYNKTRTYPEVTHMCRNFDDIREWAEARILTDFDTTRQVEDPLRKGLPFKAVDGKVY